MTGERGRPRCFDAERALQRALEVFWRHGYQGASLAELTAAMGIGKPSLYAAFGDKESLYLKALEQYGSAAAALATTTLDAEPDARRAVEAYLRKMALVLSDPALPGGCFVANGAADCGGQAIPPAVESALRAAMGNTEARLRARLEQARVDGQLAADAPLEQLAAFLSSVVAGMSILAKGGATHEKLEGVVTTAMAVWPPVSASRRKLRRQHQN